MYKITPEFGYSLFDVYVHVVCSRKRGQKKKCSDSRVAKRERTDRRDWRVVCLCSPTDAILNTGTITEAPGTKSTSEMFLELPAM